MNLPHLAAALLAAFLFAPSALAYVECESIAAFNERIRIRAPIGEALAAKRFAEVDRHFSRNLADMAAGKITDMDVAFEFGLFSTDRPDREALHAGWIKAFPKSEAAYLAQARYFTYRGWQARGSNVVGKTSASQFASMEEWFQRAWKSLDAAEQLSKHPTPEWAARIEILRTAGGREAARSLYEKALASYPTTVMVRQRYLSGQAMRWGGSERQVLQVVAEAKGLPEPDRRYLEAEALHDLAIDADNFRKDTDAATRHYERMFSLCPAFVRPAHRLARLYMDKRELAMSIDVSTRIIAQVPSDGEAYWARGWALGMGSKVNEAFGDLQRAAQLGYARAYVDLGGMYQVGAGTPRDLKKALEMCTAGYERGEAEGKVCADRVRALMQRNP